MGRVVSQSAVIADLSGTLAVGSIAFAGAFLVVDGQINLYQLIQQYAETPSWAIVLAGPVLVLSHAFGVVAIQSTSLVRAAYDAKHGRDSLEVFVRIARLDNEHIVARYEELRRAQEFLQGMTPALLILGVGALCSRIHLGAHDLFGVVTAAGCFGLGAILPWLAGRLGRHAFELCDQAETMAREGEARRT